MGPLHNEAPEVAWDVHDEVEVGAGSQQQPTQFHALREFGVTGAAIRRHSQRYSVQ